MHMSKMIQILNVPDDVHSVLKAQAALEGMTLSDYLLREVQGLAERPTASQLRQRLGSRSPVKPHLAPADAVRAERDQR